MESHKIFTPRGFTLIEMLIVIGIIAVLIWFSLFFDVNAFRGDAFRAERDMLVVALQKARADALNNIDQRPHGVALYPPGVEGYVVFEGESFDTRNVSLDQEFGSSYAVQFAPSSPHEIVFEQLSSDVIADESITLIDPTRQLNFVITINHEGTISW